jgi:hypothetical protein
LRGCGDGSRGRQARGKRPSSPLRSPAWTDSSRSPSRLRLH